MSKILVTIPAELADLAPDYLRNRMRDLVTLKDALTRKDLEGIAKLCHKTKGTAGGYGFDGLSERAKALELAAKSGDPAAVARALDEMESYLGNVEIRPAGNGSATSA